MCEAFSVLALKECLKESFILASNLLSLAVSRGSKGNFAEKTVPILGQYTVAFDGKIN